MQRTTMDMIIDSMKTYVKDERVLAGMAVALAGLSVKMISNKKPNLPPGPPVWPIVGSLPSFRNDLEIYNEFAKKYGDTYFVQLGLFGQAPTVVLNNIDLIREALLQKQDDFAGRHHLTTFDILSENGKNIAFGDITPEWRYQRKIAHVALRKYTSGNRFQELLERNVEMISEIFRQGKDQPQDVFKATSLIFCNIIASFCFGKKYDMEDPEFIHIRSLIDDVNEQFDGILLADLMPPLRHIPTQAMTLIKKSAKDMHAYFDNLMAEHKLTYDGGDLRDLTDYTIHSENEMKTSGLEEFQVKLSDAHYRQIVLDMFAAGTDTSRNTLTWALMFLANHQDVQKKAQKEIDDNIGRERTIDSQNRVKIPLAEAIIYETLRMRHPAPMGLPHSTTCDTTVGGYDIPKGTQVLINIQGMHKDPREWKNPEVFDPERFLDEHGHLAPKPNAFLPFSAGRRSCIGEAFAKSELHIILGSLLQRFTFFPPEGKMVDVTPKPSLQFISPREPILVVKER